MKTLALVALLALPCLADDLVMKDGRVISWKSLSDEGDSYALVSKDGTVTRVKKGDVEKFVIPRQAAEPATGPLTGASFSFGQKKTATTNLLPKADVERSEPIGAWKMAGSALVGESAGAWIGIQFDFAIPSEDYDLSLVAERLSGTDTFGVGVGTPDGMGGYHFDAWDGTANCLTLPAGEGEHTKGQVFKKGKPRAVKLSVRKDCLRVEVDGKEFWKGRVLWNQTGIHPQIPLRERGKLFLAVNKGTFKIHSFAVTVAQPETK